MDYIKVEDEVQEEIKIEEPFDYDLKQEDDANFEEVLSDKETLNDKNWIGLMDDQSHKQLQRKFTEEEFLGDEYKWVSKYNPKWNFREREEYWELPEVIKVLENVRVKRISSVQASKILGAPYNKIRYKYTKYRKEIAGVSTSMKAIGLEDILSVEHTNSKTDFVLTCEKEHMLNGISQVEQSHSHERAPTYHTQNGVQTKITSINTTMKLRQIAIKKGCSLCNFSCNITADLLDHICSVHKKSLNFKCELCSFTCSIIDHLKHHIEYKHNLKALSCSLCKYVSHETINLQLHVLHYHEK